MNDIIIKLLITYQQAFLNDDGQGKQFIIIIITPLLKTDESGETDDYYSKHFRLKHKAQTTLQRSEVEYRLTRSLP